jgi:DNA polymerase III delta subunit
MSRLYYQDHLRELKSLVECFRRKSLPKLIFVNGPNSFLAERTIRVLCNLVKELGQSVTTLEASDVSPDSLAEFFQQRSLFEETGFTHIRRLEKLKNPEKLFSQCQNIEKSANTVIVSCQSPTVGKKLQAVFVDHCKIHCPDVWENDVRKIAQELSSTYRVALDDMAFESLLEAVGTDLFKLDNEFRKLQFLSEEGKPISKETVASSVGAISEEKIFALDRLLLQRNYAKVSLMTKRFLDSGEGALPILGLMSRHCRQALHAMEELNGADVGPRSSRSLPLNIARQYHQYARKLNRGILETALIRCQVADLMLKSKSVDPRIILDDVTEVLSRA